MGISARDVVENDEPLPLHVNSRRIWQEGKERFDANQFDFGLGYEHTVKRIRMVRREFTGG